MTRASALPRLAHEGFVPAGPEGRTDRRAMLIPKSSPRREFIPALPEHQFSWLAGRLGPHERRALREIVERGDFTEVDGKPYLVAPLSNATIDALAAFEAEGEDRECNLEDEPGVDDEPDYDNEDDLRDATPY